MIKKASNLIKNESGIIENISGYKNELECMGLTKGCSIKAASEKNDKMTVISIADKPKSEIILLNSVASEIAVQVHSPKN